MKIIEKIQAYPVLVQSFVSISGILLTALVTYYFSKKRYTYEKLFDRKLGYLEEIYSRIISLEKDLKKYVFTIGADMKPESLTQKKEEFLSLEKNFFELQEYFWKKEIALDKNTVSSVADFINISIQTLAELEASIISQHIRDGETSFNQWRNAFKTIKEKLKDSKEQLKSDFKKTFTN